MESGQVLGPDEYVLRRVHFRAGLWPDGSLNRGAYTPNPQDTDGISVYREASAGGVTPQELVDDARKPANEYVVERISVEVFQSLGLSVEPKETPGELQGHCVVPEFTYEAYADKAQKGRWIKVQEALCRASVRVYPP